MTDEEMQRLIAGSPTKSESIRRLFRAGISKAAIARFMELRYQHVYNVLLRETPPDQEGMTESEPVFSTLQVDAKGKLQLPADFLTANGLGNGGALYCRSDPRGLTLMSRESALDHLREVARKRMPEEAALLDEILNVAGTPPTSTSQKDKP